MMFNPFYWRMQQGRSQQTQSQAGWPQGNAQQTQSQAGWPQGNAQQAQPWQGWPNAQQAQSRQGWKYAADAALAEMGAGKCPADAVPAGLAADESAVGLAATAAVPVPVRAAKAPAGSTCQTG